MKMRFSHLACVSVVRKEWHHFLANYDLDVIRQASAPNQLMIGEHESITNNWRLEAVELFVPKLNQLS
jgi:hypothetical protein